MEEEFAEQIKKMPTNRLHQKKQERLTVDEETVLSSHSVSGVTGLGGGFRKASLK